MDRRRALLLLACCAVLATAGAALAQPAPAREGGIRIAYTNAPMASVVSDLSRATGVTLIYDEKIAELGSVTIEGPPEVSRGEALAMIDSLLLLRGFAAVPGPGGARKVMAISGSPSPWRPDAQLPNSDAPVTTLIRLENADAAGLVPVIQPYLGTNSTASAFAPTNALILSGPASLLRRLRIAIDALDQQRAGPPLIWPMRVARAETVADQLREIVDEIDLPFVSSDQRQNAVLLRVRAGETERIRELVDQLDRPARGAGEFEVVKLRYADPEQLAEQLVALREDAGGSEATGAVRRAGLRGLQFDVVADLPTHSIVVRGPPETVDAVLDVVSELDRMPASVRVEVTVASVDLDDRLALGIDYLIPLTDPNDPKDLIAAVFANPSGGGFGAIDPPPSTTLPFVATFTGDTLLLPIVNPLTGEQIVIREGVSLTMAGRTVNSEVLMRPNLVITSGDEHEIFAGDNVPIPVASDAGTGTIPGTGTTGTGTTGGETGGAEAAAPGGIGNAAAEDGSGTGGTGTGSTGFDDPSLTVSQNIERKDVGTTLRVTPTVGARGGVMLELRVEVSSLAESVAGRVEDVGPTIRETIIESTIRLEPGETAVIATAAQPQVQRSSVGIPWLMDMPVLGWAFRTTAERTLNHHLLVAARAERLHPESRELADRLAREFQPSAASAARR